MRTALLLSLLLLSLAPVGAQRQPDGNPASANQDALNRAFAHDPLAKALAQNNVYIGKSLRGSINKATLDDLASKASPDRPLKIAVLNGLPESGKVFGDGGRYTRALHEYLNLKQGTLIVRTRKDVYAASDALTAYQITGVLVKYTSWLKSDLVGGLQHVVPALDAEASGEKTGNAASSERGEARAADRNPEPGGSALPWLIPIGLGGSALVWIGYAATKKSKAMATARAPVRQLHREVVEGISYADTYLDLLPPSEAATSAQQARQNAAQLLEQANEIVRTAHQPADYGRAEAVLEQARDLINKARSDIDLATGGTGVAVGVEGTEMRTVPVAANGRPAYESAPILSDFRADSIPASERGVCFFCSRPTRLSELTPVTVALNGQKRKVLACPEDIRIIQNGTTPAIQTIEEQGRPIPWYQARSYDPNLDYGRPTSTGGYGYAVNNGGDDFMTGLLVGSLLSPPAPIPYPVFVNPAGYATNSPLDYAEPPLDNAPDSSGDFGGSDFGNNDSGGIDLDSNVGGVDFDSDSGGSDFGSSDFGSSDSGGSDFGGSDFGGGGDS